MSLLELKSAEYGYPPPTGSCIQALAGIDLTVNAGDFWAVLGRNGSGKTSLLKMLCGLIDPTAGTALYQGKPLPQEFSGICGDRIVMVTAESDHQILGATVEEDLAFGLYQQGFSPSQANKSIDAVLELFGLEDFRCLEPEMCSTSIRKLVAIAAGMVVKPDVLLLDEPFSFLAPEHEVLLRNRLSCFLESGGAVVMTTNRLVEARGCNLALVLDGGRAVISGTLERILADPVKLETWGIAAPLSLLVSSHLAAEGILTKVALTPKDLVTSIWR